VTSKKLRLIQTSRNVSIFLGIIFWTARFLTLEFFLPVNISEPSLAEAHLIHINQAMSNVLSVLDALFFMLGLLFVLLASVKDRFFQEQRRLGEGH
jgi:hypothetical protein